MFCFAAVSAAILVLSASSASAAAVLDTFDKIVAFGDSLSDNGNTFRLAGYPAAPYFQGRYSNGPSWVEHVANATVGTGNLTNVAYGTAYVSKALLSPPLNLTAGEIDVPDLTQQLQFFLGNHTAHLPNPNTTLYTLSAGASDYEYAFKQPHTKPDYKKVAGAIVAFVQALHDSPLNATNFLVVYLPDFADLPSVKEMAANSGSQASAMLTSLHELTNYHNMVMHDGLSDLATKIPELQIRLMELDGLAQNSSTNFKNGISPCVTLAPNATVKSTERSKDPKNVVVCQDPDSYWYWDDEQPTAAAHKMIGDLALKTLAAPSSLFPNSNNRTSPAGGPGVGGKNATTQGRGSSAKSTAVAHTSVLGGGLAIAAAVASAFFAL
ncbi:hypothetical protein HDU88_004824 [Geranomyces variabilis]|nr:hypothetical protein HDU88_004824 [Geranomyces variabilis]